MNELWTDIVAFLGKIPLLGKLFAARPKVAVLRLSGVISDSNRQKSAISYQKFSKIIDKAFDKADLAVALVINSPGGSPAQSSLIGNHIRRLAEEKELPVFAFVEDVAASGGYWLACAADEIYAQDSSIVGSIGVISASFGFEDFIKKHDIHRRVYTSGKEKSFMDPFVAEKKNDIDRLLEIQKEIHKIFIKWVKSRRGKRLSGTAKTLFEGQFWTAEMAVEKGIIDEVGDVMSVMRGKFGDDIKLIDVTPDKMLPSFLSFLGAHTQRQGTLPDQLLETLETHAHWSRYGF